MNIIYDRPKVGKSPSYIVPMRKNKFDKYLKSEFSQPFAFEVTITKNATKRIERRQLEMMNGVNGNHPQCPTHIRFEAVENCPDILESDFVFPDLPSKCTWNRNHPNEASSHTKRPFNERPKVFGNILQVIGMTPMVKLNHIPKSLGIKCQMYAKCEFLNPGGSVKDRIGYRMVQDAEDKGLLKPGVSTIIEPTSGNTGIGLAMASAVRGYRCIIVLPEKNSDEKVNTLKALGAEIIRTRTDARFDEPDSLVAVAQRLQKEIPNSIILNQYTNAGNPLAHYDGTGSEIVYQLDGKVDMVVLGAGTGGTVTGIGRKIKEECPECIVVAVDPEGSILARPEELNNSDVVVYEVEGIGYDFIPTVLDHTVVDKWIKSNDLLALPMARRLIREEGFLCGGSSGAAMSAAVELAKDLREDQTCVVLCPDNIRNYMTKFVVDNWLEARNFKDSDNAHCHSWWNRKVSELIVEGQVSTLPNTTQCQQVINELKIKNVEQIAIVDGNSKLQGMATISYLMNKILDLTLKPSDPIGKALFKKYIKIKSDATIGRLSRILAVETYAVVVADSREDDVNKESTSVERVVAVLTQKDLLKFLTKSKET